MKDTSCSSSHSGLWLLFILDFFSKQWAFGALEYPLRLTSFLSFDIALNRGISWSMFASGNPLVFMALTGVIGAFLFFLSWYSARRREEGHCILGEKLIVIGGTGNFLDRLYYGGVIDFIHFSYEGWSFPIFNIADICICIGVALLLWQTIVGTLVHE